MAARELSALVFWFGAANTKTKCLQLFTIKSLFVQYIHVTFIQCYTQRN